MARIDITSKVNILKVETVHENLLCKLTKIFTNNESRVSDYSACREIFRHNNDLLDFFRGCILQSNASENIFNPLRQVLPFQYASIFSDYYKSDYKGIKQAVENGSLSDFPLITNFYAYIERMLEKQTKRENARMHLAYFLENTNLENRINEYMRTGLKFSKALRRSLSDLQRENQALTDVIDDNDIQFLAERLSGIRDIKIIMVETKLPLNRKNWHDVYYYTGNRSSCWQPDGCYSESSDIFNEYINSGTGAAYLFFSNENNIAECTEESPYIIIDGESYTVAARLWYILENNFKVFFNPYSKINGFSRNDILSFAIGKYKTISINHSNAIYVNNDYGYTACENRINSVTIGDGNLTQCCICGDYMNDDDAIYHDDNCYCENCFYDNFTACHHCGEYCNNDDAINVNGDDYCEYCFENHCFTCDGCGENFENEYCNSTYDYCYCDACYSEIVKHCHDCDCEIDTEHDLYSDNESGILCQDCAVKHGMKQCQKCNRFTSELINFADGDGKHCFCMHCHEEYLRWGNTFQYTLFTVQESYNFMPVYFRYKTYDSVNHFLYVFSDENQRI